MRDYRKLATLLVCASCFLLAGLAALDAVPQSKTVRVLISVTDKKGSVVPNLKDADFTVREEGKPQTITNLTRADQSPLSVVLMIDKSGSTARSAQEMTKAVDASLQFTRSVLQPGRDKVALVTFDSVVTRDQDFTDDLQRLSQILIATLTRQSWGGTSFHDAIYGASTLFENRQGRRLMLVIGDGVDTASRLSLPEVMKVVHKSDIEIVTIWMPGPSPSTPLFANNTASQGRESLKTISEETGGRHFAYAELKDFDRFRQEVNAQYLIEYQSTNSKLDDKFRKIRVETVNKNYKVRHRAGYRP